MIFHLRCSDQNVFISEVELLHLCRAGNVLEALMYGHQNGIGERKEKPDEYLFQAWPSFLVNLLRSCVRQKKFPFDSKARSLIVCGNLREFADAFGGFDIVDMLLEEECKKRKCSGFNKCLTAVDDENHMYDWRTVITEGPDEKKKETRELEKEGYVYISAESRLNYIIFIFRRLKNI
jgi:hypothetical protein